MVAGCATYSILLLPCLIAQSALARAFPQDFFLALFSFPLSLAITGQPSGDCLAGRALRPPVLLCAHVKRAKLLGSLDRATSESESGGKRRARLC